jgi:hypothetical protein
MSTYDHIRCPICFVPWQEHSPDCPRHDYRPGVQAAPSLSADSGELPVLLRRLADDLAQVGATPFPGIYAPWWLNGMASDLVTLAAAEIERLNGELDRATDGLLAAVAASHRDSAKWIALLDAAVCECPPGTRRWRWRVGWGNGAGFTSRADAVADLSRVLKLEGEASVGAAPMPPSEAPERDRTAELGRLRAALDRIAAEAVVPTAGRPDRWEWAVGRVCSCTYFTRDEARAGFRRRFGLDGDGGGN